MQPALVPFTLSLDKLSTHSAIAEIIKTNEKSLEYGLVLTQNDAVQLVETRRIALNANGRIEVGSATIGKIIDEFYDSAFINQGDYAEILQDLLELFYYMKNETLELISDDELIELMKDYFEHRCQGSLDLLKHRELEKLARNLRFGVSEYAKVSEDYEEDYLTDFYGDALDEEGY